MTALGARSQLKVHIHGAMEAGSTRDEFIEVIMQMVVYPGFPAALDGFAAAREAFAERERRGTVSRRLNALTPASGGASAS
jgi:4-carboxymuconolactone decarboxylase